MATKRPSILALSILVLQLIPTTALAAACSVSALDTVAGLGTQVTMHGCGSGSVTLTMQGPGSAAYTQSVALDASGNALTLIPSKYTTRAGTYSVSAAGSAANFSVLADRADDENSSLSISKTSIKNNGKDAVTVTAVLHDKYDNAVAGRPIALVSSRSTDDIDALSAETDEMGRMVWSVKATKIGTMTLIPYDSIGNRQLALRKDVQVTGGSSLLGSMTAYAQGGDDLSGDLAAGTVDHFEIEMPQGVMTVKANELFGMTIRAMNGNTLVRGYVGTLIVESSDLDAELPKKGEDPKLPDAGRIDMRSVDQGERKLALTFVLRKSGPQTITVYDKTDPSIQGEVTLNVTRGGTGDEQIIVLDPKDRAHVKGTTVLVQGRAPSLVNLKVKGGLSTVDAETDEEGVFRVNVPLNPADKEVTLFVVSESGTMESAPVHLIIDNDPPKIDTITLDPEDGKTETPGTITVKSEPDLTVTATLEGTPVTLTETGAGLYIGKITAPKKEGNYDITINVKDTVGNEANMLTKWNVKPKEMPTVMNVKAEGQPMQVSIKWDAVTTIPVAEYKIYIASESDPSNHLYSIGTGKPVTSAVIKDLPLGQTYLFSLTAIDKDGNESPEKSKSAAAMPLGMAIKATPGQDSLLLEWNPPKDLPLDHYVLEFNSPVLGDSPARISVNGQANSHMLRDLLNGVSYEIRLTPVTVTGKTMTDLSATIRSTPGGSGFHPGAEDPAPSDIIDDLHPGANLPPVIYEPPSTPGSGVSSMVGAILLIVAVAAGLLYRSHRKQQALTQEFLRAMQDRYQS